MAHLTFEEHPHLFADAYATLNDQAVFVSLWGRETAIKSLLAQLSLPANQGGIDYLVGIKHEDADTLLDQVNLRFYIDSCQHHITRCPTQGFGELVNLWIYHHLCVCPDRSKAQAIVFFPESSLALEEGALQSDSLINSVWPLIKNLCPFPLLDTWQAKVMLLLQSTDCIRSLDDSMGINGLAIELALEPLTEAVQNAIRQGELILP